MDPITASGVISIGKELINKVSSSLGTKNQTKPATFINELEKSQSPQVALIDPSSRAQKIANELKSDLIKDPETAAFFKRNENNQLFIEKRADGSVQFISSSGENFIVKPDSKHCVKALELFNLCLENKINTSSLRPNAVTFNS
jgi:hypothetical protein